MLFLSGKPLPHGRGSHRSCKRDGATAENCFLATKVAFVNQFYEVAQVLDVDFLELRRLWLLDPRIGPSHSSVTPERGFRGRCLPKDISAIVALMRLEGGAPLLQAVMDYNVAICRTKDQERLAASRASAR
jgi:UDP-glucose 6-dehydrogenase